MANFCLIPQAVDKFKAKLIDGTIDPAKLSQMTSEERHAFFKDIVGHENAQGVNSLFESKLLLKNQQRGMVTWAKKVSGITPEVRRDMITRIQKMDHILNPQEEQQFLKDLASTKLGVDVTHEEAKQISQLSQKVQETKTAMETGGDRLVHGRAKVELGNYVSNLQEQASKMAPTDYLKHPVKGVSATAGITKSVVASMDNSAIFRQGWKTLITNPVIWQKNARQSFVDLVKQFGNKPVLDSVKADVVSRPNYDIYQKMKLATTTIEEPYPSHLPAKVPILGRAYKASEAAYTGFVYRMRADVADKYIEIAKRSGVNLNDKQELESIGKLVNALTGRGALGAAEKVASGFNNVFFSPRFVKSNIDTLTAHQFQKGVTPFVRKQAAVNLLKIISATAGVLATANAVKPGSVEWDPRSSDFGQIRLGNTRFDVTGGMRAITTLASRLVTMSSKSSQTKQVTSLHSGKYGAPTGLDAVFNFMENKLSPTAGLIRDILKGQDFQGNKPTVKGEIGNLFTPLSISTFMQAKQDPHGGNALAVAIADGLGLSANTYGKSNKNWSQNPSTEQTQFLQKVGPDKFKQANNDYNTRLNNWTANIINNSTYKSLPESQKQAVMSAGKAKIQSEVFKDYGFKYKKAPASSTDKAAKKTLLQLTH